MAKKKLEQSQSTSSGKVKKVKKENSKLVKHLDIKSISLSHLRKAYDLIHTIPERSYNYKMNSVREVLESTKKNSISPEIKFQLLEQTLYGLLDYRVKVPVEKLQEYDKICEEVAVEANLIQPKIPEENLIRYIRKDGEYK